MYIVYSMKCRVHLSALYLCLDFFANSKTPSKKTPSKKPVATTQAKLPFSPTKSPVAKKSPTATTSTADSDTG